MEIITTHTATDFDALAAMVAAKKLYPEAQLIIGGALDRNVKEFIELYQDSLDLKSPKDVDLDRVDRLILVDTKQKDRLGGIEKVLDNPGIEIHTYDHHPPSENDVRSDMDITEEMGATTTILVRLLRERNISLTPLEATILALGIYEDTGSLTFSSTRVADIKAAAYLVGKGAKLSVVSSFISRALTEGQRLLLEKLIRSLREYFIKGIRLLTAQAEVRGYVGEIAMLTHKLVDIENAEAIFVIVKMDSHIYVVGRSRTRALDVDEVLREFGGGGHPEAASASIKNLDFTRIEADLLEVVGQKIRPISKAGDIMSSPVKTIDVNTTIEEARKIMLRYGHSGLPVMEGNKLVGIICRKDIDKAGYHGLGNTPVSRFMSRSLITIEPETSLKQMQELMIENSIGRLPVVEDERLLGIVTRKDLLRTLYGEDNLPKTSFATYKVNGEKSIIRRSLKKPMEDNLPEWVFSLLRKVGEVADEVGYPAYAVGGFVRDLLLGVENLDIDIVVEGEGITFAKALARVLGGRVRSHEAFGTAVIILPDDFHIDVATSRIEYYEYPAALPKIDYSSIKKDLYRRDFTINSMAIRLNKRRFGELVDFYGGQRDLANGVIRVLYNLSFVEDPTRLFRAIRFELRYNFHIEGQTVGFIQNTVDLDMIKNLSGERLRDELLILFREVSPYRAIKRMVELNILRFIHPDLRLTPDLEEELRRVEEMLSYHQELVRKQQVEVWLVYFILMFQDFRAERIKKIGNRLRLTKKNIELMSDTPKLAQKIISALSAEKEYPPSFIYHKLISLPLEATFFLMAKADKRIAIDKMSLFLDKLRSTEIEVDGNDLLEMGLKPSLLFKELLTSVLDAKLDGKVRSREEQLKYIEELLSRKAEEGIKSY